MLRKKVLFLLVASMVLSVVSGAFAADYPVRPVELVIPFGEGSASDTFARKFAEIVNRDVSVPIQPVNKKAGGGLVGMVYAFSQPNDGYTLLSITPSHVIADVMTALPSGFWRISSPSAASSPISMSSP